VNFKYDTSRDHPTSFFEVPIAAYIRLVDEIAAVAPRLTDLVIRLWPMTHLPPFVPLYSLLLAAPISPYPLSYVP
jgi:hypothetical protein